MEMLNNDPVSYSFVAEQTASEDIH